MTNWIDSVTMGGMFSNGNIFGPDVGSSLSPGFGEDHRHTVPPWLFGLRQSDDRGDT